jgi:hypothetical protein
MKAITSASIMDMIAIKVDSDKNCSIKFFLICSKHFSDTYFFARLAERAVVRFMKLMQAINKIKRQQQKKYIHTEDYHFE